MSVWFNVHIGWPGLCFVLSFILPYAVCSLCHLCSPMRFSFLLSTCYASLLSAHVIQHHSVPESFQAKLRSRHVLSRALRDPDDSEVTRSASFCRVLRRHGFTYTTRTSLVLGSSILLHTASGTSSGRCQGYLRVMPMKEVRLLVSNLLIPKLTRHPQPPPPSHYDN